MDKKVGKAASKTQRESEQTAHLVCGIVMPISSIDGCSEAHWQDVLDIIKDAVGLAGFEGRLVSDADDVSVIHKRIVTNLYDDPIVVVDTSCRNPNVMFELGMRLAFDKPTIIIQDDKTPYSFDTQVVEHLSYPRDLRYHVIKDFKKQLAGKITNSLKAAQDDPEYTPFLKHFNRTRIAEIDDKDISKSDYIIQELQALKAEISSRFHVSHTAVNMRGRSRRRSTSDIENRFLAPDTISVTDLSPRQIAAIRDDLIIQGYSVFDDETNDLMKATSENSNIENIKMAIKKSLVRFIE